MGKLCTKCGVEKELSEYSFRSDNDKRRNECKDCIKKYMRVWRGKNKEKIAIDGRRWREENSVRAWATYVRRNHRRDGFKFNATINEIIDFAECHGGACYYCGIELDYSYGTKDGKIQKNSPSLDRIYNNQVMTLENSQILCSKCNTTKSDRTHDEFVQYCKTIVEKFGD